MSTSPDKLRMLRTQAAARERRERERVYSKAPLGYWIPEEGRTVSPTVEDGKQGKREKVRSVRRRWKW